MGEKNEDQIEVTQDTTDATEPVVLDNTAAVPETVSEPENSEITEVSPEDHKKVQPSSHGEEFNPEKPKNKRSSVVAKTHSKRRSSSSEKVKEQKVRPQRSIVKWAGVAFGALAVMAIMVSGISSQYYKDKVLPNVAVIGVNMGGKTDEQVKTLINDKQKALKITLQSGTKKLEPNLKEIGYTVDTQQTIDNAKQAKRSSGILGKLQFWHRVDVPAVVTVNDTLLGQYVENNIPEIIVQPTDATLAFDAKTNTFSVTNQASGEGADMTQLKANLVVIGNNLLSTNVPVITTMKAPNIKEADLEPLVEPANALVGRIIKLTGLGYNFTAKPSDIASWITPTPKDDGKIHLVVDPAKIQSFVEEISKRISTQPQDTKVLKDDTTGQEVVIQEGRDGTELADQQQLADAIANSLADGKDITQTMNITVAAHKTVNLNAYDKWIEVDLSEQRTTAYEHATPVKTFTVATGVSTHPTVKGEFAIWLKVRSQTMSGGSKADGSYYSIPNVEWVSYFYQDYALHGAWWRKVFGYPASHGCVNMTNDDAHWVYDWAPVGTKVIVHD